MTQRLEQWHGRNKGSAYIRWYPGDVLSDGFVAAETEPEQEEAEPDPPFSSHEEADRELLKEEERNLFR